MGCMQLIDHPSLV